MHPFASRLKIALRRLKTETSRRSHIANNDDNAVPVGGTAIGHRAQPSEVKNKYLTLLLFIILSSVVQVLKIKY